MDGDDESGLGVAVGRTERVVASSDEEGCFFTLEREEMLPRNREVSIVQAGFAASSGSRWWGKPAARLAPPSEEGATESSSFRRFQPPPHRGRIDRCLTVREIPRLIPSLQRWFTVSLHNDLLSSSSEGLVPALRGENPFSRACSAPEVATDVHRWHCRTHPRHHPHHPLVAASLARPRRETSAAPRDGRPNRRGSRSASSPSSKRRAETGDARSGGK